MRHEAKGKRTRGRRWMTIRRNVLSERPLCARCESLGKVVLATQVDHIVPVAAGGTDEPGNLQPLCTECHSDKTAKDNGWRQRVAPAPGW